MNTLPRIPRGCVALASLLLATSPLALAQTNPAPAPAAPATDTEVLAPTKTDGVLELPEFSVSEKSDEGRYTAADTTSGSRMNESTKNLPYSVSSLTSSFLKDFAIFDLTDDLSYISGIVGNSDSFTFSVRGYTGGNNVLYDGHFRTSPIVAAQVARVELIKGPAASIYGQANPGGTLLVTTNKPTSVQKEEVDVSVGSYGTNSDIVHLSGPLPIFAKSAPKLFYNVDLSYLHRVYDNPGPRRQEKAVAGAITYKPDDKTNITVEANWQKFWIPVAGDWAIPYDVYTAPNPYTGANQTFYSGFARWLRHDYYASTVDYVSRESTGITISLQREITSWLSFQTSYDHYNVPAETYTTLGSGGTVNAATGLIGASATPAWSTIYGTGWSYSADLLGHYKLGTTDNQTLFTIDDYLNNRKNYSETAIAGTFTPGVTSFNPLLPITSAYDPRDSNHFTSATTLNNAVQSEGFGANDQIGFFDKKVLLYGGYRHDYVKGYQSNPNAALTAVAYTGATPGSGRQSFIHDSNDAVHGGVSVAITDSVSAYTSVYQGFSPFGTSVPLTATVPAGASAFVVHQDLKALSPASTTSLGEEVGLKGDFKNHTLTFGADVYNTKQQNVGVTELSDPNDPNSGTVTVNEGDQTAKGFEVEGEYNVAKLHSFLSYTYVDARVENQGVNVAANGHRPRGTPYDSLSGAVSYQIIPKLSFQISGRFQGNTPALSPSTGLIKNPTTSLLDKSDGRETLRTPAYALFNLGVTYIWRNGNWRESVNATVKNVFDRYYITPGNGTAYVGDGRGVYFTYSIAR